MSSVASSFVDFGARVQEASGRMNPRVRQAVLLAGLVALGGFWGAAIAVAGVAALLMFVAILCCVFCVRDFRFGVVCLILLVPISGSYFFPHEMFGITGLNPLNLLLVTTLGAYFLRAMGTGSVRHFVPRSLFLVYLLPIICGAAMGVSSVKYIPAIFKATDQIFFNEPVGYVRDMLFKPMTLVFYSLLVAAAVWRSKRPEKFITPLLVSVWMMGLLILGFVLAAGVGISDLAGTFSRHFLSSLGMHANDLGRLYVIAYALLLFVWDRADNMALKTVLFFSMGVVVASLVLTFSRGAYVGFVIVNAIFMITRVRGRTLLLAAFAIPIFLYFLPGAVWSRMEAGKGEGANAVSAGRLDEIWTPLMPEIFDHPVLGNGLGSIMFSKAMQTGNMESYTHPHNAYLEAYLDLGFVGLVLLVGFWLYVWWRFRQYSKDERVHPHLQGLFAGGAAGLISFLIAGFAGSSLMPSPEQSFLWFAVGVLYGEKLRLKYGLPKGA
jgi:O-antigen ligase